MTHNYFSWQYHAVLSSKPHLTLLLLLSRGHSAGGHCGPPLSAASLVELKILTDFNWLNSHVDICIYHFITPTTSDQSCDCVRLIYSGESCSETSLIDSSVKDQYATPYLRPVAIPILMKSVYPTIWPYLERISQFTMFISYNNNHCITSSSFHITVS